MQKINGSGAASKCHSSATLLLRYDHLFSTNYTRSHLIKNTLLYYIQTDKFTVFCFSLFFIEEKLIVQFQVHADRKQFPCGLCSAQFRHKSSLVRHMCQHTGQRPHPCSACRKSFLTPLRLQHHRARRHNNLLDDEALSPTASSSAAVSEVVVSTEYEIVGVLSDTHGFSFSFQCFPEEITF